jgi:hypothetical protein
MEFMVVILVVVLVVAGAIYSSVMARRRREAMAAMAASLGLRFDPSKDYGIDEAYSFLGKLCQGSKRYAFNRISGRYRDQDILIFDFHYETYSRNSKGHRQTHHHYLSCFLLRLPARVPELNITREGWGSKLAQWVGYDDIDFESAEFSSAFCVRSQDKKFAYDICHARFMEYLLAHRDLSLELDQNVLSLIFNGRLSVEQIAGNLNRLLDVRGHIPEYVWKR